MRLVNKKYLTFCFLLIITTIHSQQSNLFLNEPLISKKQGLELSESYQKVKKEQDTVAMIQNLMELSKYHRSRLDFGTAFNYAGDALFLSNQIQDTLLLAKAHKEQGVLDFLFKQDNNAGVNFKKSNQYFKYYYKGKDQSNRELLNSYFNLVLYYQRIQQEEPLLKYIDTCQKIAKEQKIRDYYTIYFNEKKASTHIWKKEYGEAIKLVNQSIEKINNSSEETSFLNILYACLGKIYNYKGDYQRSKEYFKKAIEVEDPYGEYAFFKAYVYEKYGEMLAKTDHHKEAYKNLRKSRSIYNKYLNPRNESTQSFLTLKDRYRDQLNISNQKINFQRLKISEIEHRILSFKIYLILGVFIIVLLGVFIWIKARSKKHQLEQEESEKKIEANNKELTINTLKLIEKEEIISTLKSQLLETDKSSSTKSLIKSIDKNSGNLWEDFNQRFTSLNKGFYERLQKKVPDLSAAELKLCALIKLNFTGKEMAYLLGISLGSVHVARHRLRKKINLDRKTNLTAFIAGI
ncbi:hypothetical protein [Wenyingzhuangia sp. IMCC45574]